MDIMISIVHENWDIVDDLTTMAALVLWWMCWIHPFVEGNGRTARAACYYLLCLKFGDFIPGHKILPERIRGNRDSYYEALRAADEAYNSGQYNVEDLSAYLRGLLREQISDR